MNNPVSPSLQFAFACQNLQVQIDLDKKWTCKFLTSERILHVGKGGVVHFAIRLFYLYLCFFLHVTCTITSFFVDVGRGIWLYPS